MTARHCINHPERPAVANCFQCHKPICELCCYQAPTEGTFCSSECHDQYLAYHSRRQAAVSRGRLKSLVVGLVILGVLAAGAVLVGGRLGLPILKPIRDAILSHVR